MAAESFKISLTDKPHLSRLLDTNPKLAKEVINTFVSLMETAAEDWAELPKKLHKDLTFSQLVGGVLHGALDVKDINPEAYDVFFEEVHPLSLLSSRPDPLGGMRYANWRKHFDMPDDAEVSEATISEIFRKMLRYARYIDLPTLYKHIDANQITAYRGLGHVQVERLPFTPALRYQQKHLGDLHVGKFFDNIGFFACGSQPVVPTVCPACKHESIIDLGSYVGCRDCNAGFRIEEGR